MRRRGDDIQISFFSFQDIVTSLAGIMIFIALMLILDLTTAVFSGGGSPPVSTTPKKEAERRILQLQQQLAELRISNERMTREARALAAVDSAQLQADIRQCEKDLDEMRQRHASVSAQRRDQEHQLEEALNGNTAIQKEIAALAQAKAKLDREARKVIVTLKGKDDGKSVLLVELSQSKATMGMVSGDQPPQVLLEKDPDKFSAAVAGQLKAYDPAKFDVLILYKPSAFTHQKLVSLLLDSGFRVGSEPIPEDRSVF